MDAGYGNNSELREAITQEGLSHSLPRRRPIGAKITMPYLDRFAFVAARASVV